MVDDLIHEISRKYNAAIRDYQIDDGKAFPLKYARIEGYLFLHKDVYKSLRSNVYESAFTWFMDFGYISTTTQGRSYLHYALLELWKWVEDFQILGEDYDYTIDNSHLMMYIENDGAKSFVITMRDKVQNTMGKIVLSKYKPDYFRG